MSSLSLPTRISQSKPTDVERTNVPSPYRSASTPSPGPHQKLFYQPGTIEETEEEDEEEDKKDMEGQILFPGMPSPVVLRRNQYYIISPRKVPSLARISTNNSSLTHIAGTRQDSYRKSFRTGAIRDVRKRTVFKNGDFNIIQTKRPLWEINRWLVDLFTTLVEARWKWTLLAFAASFLLSWLLFAVVWWLLFFVHGDLQPQNMPPLQDQNNFSPCVIQIFDFSSAFLFSVETQSTIGYGGRMITEECPEGIFLVCFQSIVAVIIDGYFVGIVMAKLTRPRKRTKTILFSRNALIAERDGKLCLMFRVGDVQLKHLTGASVRLQYIHDKETKEGDVLFNYIEEIDVAGDGCGPDLFFIWPFTMVHEIDEDSPFYQMTPEELLQGDFELVVILEGSHQSTGQDIRAMTSYLAHEILWGFKFEDAVSYDKERQGYVIDYCRFNNTVAVDTPLCAASELEDFYEREEKGEKPERKQIKDKNEEEQKPGVKVKLSIKAAKDR